MTSPYRDSHGTESTSSLKGRSHAGVGGSLGASTMRPRNRKLISTELMSSGDADFESESGSRGVSPIPARYPSRNISGGTQGAGRQAAVGGLLAPGNGRTRASSPGSGFGIGKGLWDGGWSGSWSALQDLASSVLSGEVTDKERTGKSGLQVKRVRGNSTAKKPPTSWGPSGLPIKKDDSIGVGSLAARDNELKNRKKASVLESHERVNGGLDVAGRYKRRTSSELPRESDQIEDEEDALVYVHPVKPQDTLAGVVLKYNCQPAVFRKANRLWPHDVIQVRKVVLLPVDACSIKGRPCDPPVEGQGIDLLAKTPEIEESPISTRMNGGTSWGSFPQNGSSSTPFDILPIKPTKSDDEEQPWTHVRWVLIDSSPNAPPVEIARLSRKTLGYFPPRRRKSQTTISTVSTPRASIDIPSISRTSDSAMGTPPRRLSNLSGTRPVAGSYFPGPTSYPSRTRAESIGESGRAQWMRGPGGVGTFERNVRKPGPAQDGLNSWAAKHLPGFSVENLQSSAIIGGETANFGFRDELGTIGESPYNPGGNMSESTTPAGQGIGLEQAAAAIEGWVRRLAVKGPGTPKMRPGGKVMPEAGDLIELLDGTGSDDGRGFEPAVPHISSTVLSVQSGGRSGGEDSITSIRPRAGKMAKGD
jgi:hypothetical protein